MKRLLQRVQQTIHKPPNQVRYATNGFVIAPDCFVPKLTDTALAVGEAVGKVEVDMGKTECRVPDAVACIQKVQARVTIGKKRTTARC